jgi:hypothetical protein
MCVIYWHISISIAIITVAIIVTAVKDNLKWQFKKTDDFTVLNSILTTSAF